MKSVKKLTISALIIAIYVVVMVLTQSFAFGAYQIRIATSLYSLSYIYPFLILPLGLSNTLSNAALGGLGFFDIFGGAIVGIITSSLIYLIKRYNLNYWLIALPIIFVPGLIVPIWLSAILNLPYKVLAMSLCIGQVIPGIVGAVLAGQLKRILSL